MEHDSPAASKARHWLRLAITRAQHGDLVGAMAAYECTISVDPKNISALKGLARARFASQDMEACRRSVEQLRRHVPDAAFTHLFAGHVYKAFGDSADARVSYCLAIEREPTCGEALYNLVDLAPYGADDTIAAQLAELALRDDLPVADRVNIAFAYARILDRKGLYPTAFDFLRRANDLARDELAGHGIKYDPPATEAFVSRVIAQYPAGAFSNPIDPLPIDLTPIFVVGMPRSGTTLVEQVLASHADVEAGGERPFAVECANAFRESRRIAGRSGPIEPGNPDDAELLKTARERYLDSLFEHNLNARCVVDKLTTNFAIAGFLRLMFPEAGIIHCRRHPSATGFSVYAANFGVPTSWKYDLASLAHYYNQYSRLMSHWEATIPGRFISVTYEDLVRDPKAQIPAILKALCLSFDPACLEFHKHRRPILTASHGQVRRPMYTHAIDHWMNYISWLGPVKDLQNR